MTLLITMTTIETEGTTEIVIITETSFVFRASLLGDYSGNIRAKRSVMASTSAFLACHQCGLSWLRLKFWGFICSIF